MSSPDRPPEVSHAMEMAGFTRDKVQRAKLQIEKRYGATVTDQEWFPCGHTNLMVEFCCKRTNTHYIACLDTVKNKLRVFTHTKTLNLQ